ncbi:cytochrome c oxidase subunit 3 [Azospirillum sp. ST 5-10]|uniref:cytochrome c oxidase subunit 3 n=1 Tax=unclassified Azospirillum TaxID=2630922 RepID=UPI003F4A306E
MSDAVRQQEDAFAGLPGHPMMWILILSELAVFGAAFVGFAAARALDPATFDTGQMHLDRLLGGLNTLVLVTSGYLAARGVAAARRGRPAGRWMVAASAGGTVFLAVKALEYAATIAAGYGINSDSFFTLYFLLTGFHALHVVMGIAILLIVARHASVENLETGAAFWHMVDLIWVLLYPLVYLIR